MIKTEPLVENIVASCLIKYCKEYGNYTSPEDEKVKKVAFPILKDIQRLNNKIEARRDGIKRYNQIINFIDWLPGFIKWIFTFHVAICKYQINENNKDIKKFESEIEQIEEQIKKNRESLSGLSLCGFTDNDLENGALAVTSFNDAFEKGAATDQKLGNLFRSYSINGKL